LFAQCIDFVFEGQRFKIKIEKTTRSSGKTKKRQSELLQTTSQEGKIRLIF